MGICGDIDRIYYGLKGSLGRRPNPEELMQALITDAGFLKILASGLPKDVSREDLLLVFEEESDAIGVH